MYSRADRKYPWVESVILLFAAFLAYELKRQFGLYAHRVFGLSSVTHEAWLGLGTQELMALAAVVLGLAVYQHTALPNAPLLERWLYRDQAKPKEALPIWRPALIATALTLAIAALLNVIAAHLGHADKLFSTLHSKSIPHATLVKVWAMYSIALVGAPIEEEIHFRLGLVSILVWLLALAWPRADRRGVRLLWIPIILVGIYFGYAHVVENLETAQVGNIYLSTLIAPQTWAGIIFGYVFCTYGLETAILTHFITDASAPIILGIVGILTHLH